jgi:hypothetical protein
VDHWRHYAAWLEPLRVALGPAIESWTERLESGAPSP